MEFFKFLNNLIDNIELYLSMYRQTYTEKVVPKILNTEQNHVQTLVNRIQYLNWLYYKVEPVYKLKIQDELRSLTKVLGSYLGTEGKDGE